MCFLFQHRISETVFAAVNNAKLYCLSCEIPIFTRLYLGVSLWFWAFMLLDTKASTGLVFLMSIRESDRSGCYLFHPGFKESTRSPGVIWIQNTTSLCSTVSVPSNTCVWEILTLIFNYSGFSVLRGVYKRWWIMVVFSYWDNGGPLFCLLLLWLASPFWSLDDFKWNGGIFRAFPGSRIAVYICGGQVDFC